MGSLRAQRAEAWPSKLGMQPPGVEHPGYWHTEDGFVALSTLVSEQEPRELKVRALLTYDPKNLRERHATLLREAYPDYDSMNEEERKDCWARIMKLHKKARTELVGELLDSFEKHGVHIPSYNVEVHRMTNTIYATLSLDTLESIIELHESHAFDPLRRIKIDQCADF